MDFAFSNEQEELRATVRRFFEAEAPPAALRRAMEAPTGHDAALWKRLAAELGLPGVHLPEAAGGQGGGFLELGIVLEEAGRALLPAPLLAHALATLLVAATPDGEARRRWLATLAAGAEIASVAWAEAGGTWDAAGVACEALGEGDALRLRGTKHFVLDGGAADRLVVVARRPGTRGEDGLVVAGLPADGPGVAVVPLETTDPLRRLARVELDGAAADPLADGPEVADLLRDTAARAAIALAQEMVGGAQRCLDMAVAYAKVRVQFGRPIGSFQAVQHKAAEVLLELELARSAAYWASWVAGGGDGDLATAAHLAKSVCGDAYRLAAAENVQIHGGVGFTWEHDAHLHLKRAQSCDVLFGDAAFHRQALARRLGV